MIATLHPWGIPRLRTRPHLAALAALVASCLATTATAQGMDDPGADDGLAWAYLAAAGPLEAIKSEHAALLAAHPDLVSMEPPQATGPDLQNDPAGGYGQAAYAMAELRIHVLFDLPLGANHLAIPGQEALQRYDAWRDAITDEANAMIVARMPAPAPGTALEDLVASRLPAYHVAAQSRTLTRLAATTSWDEPQMDTANLVSEMSQVEAQRVAWQYPLDVPMAPEADMPQLSMTHVRSMLANSSFHGPQVAPLARDASDAAQHAMMTSDPFAAIAYAVLAERAHVASTTWLRSEGDERLLMAQLRAELGGLDGVPASLLSLEATSRASLAVSSHATDPESAGDASRAMADAIGHMAAARMVRGLPAPVAADGERATSGVLAPVVGAVLAASALAVLVRRHR